MAHNNARKDHFQDLPTLMYGCEHNRDWKMHTMTDNCDVVLGLPSSLFLAGEVHLGNLVTDSDYGTIWKIIETSLTNQRPYQLSFQIKLPTGEIKNLFDQGQGVFKKSGKLIELNGFITDVTEPSQEANETKICIDDVFKLAQQLKFIDHFQPNNVTLREFEVALYVCQGASMKEIGQKLQLSSRTIEAHLNNIKAKLGCYSKSQLKQLFLMSEKCRTLIINSLKQ